MHIDTKKRESDTLVQELQRDVSTMWNFTMKPGSKRSSLSSYPEPSLQHPMYLSNEILPTRIQSFLITEPPPQLSWGSDTSCLSSQQYLLLTWLLEAAPLCHSTTNPQWIKLQFSNVWYLSNAPRHSRANNCRSLGHASLLCLCHFRLCSKGGKSACFHPRKWGSKHRSFDFWSFLRKTRIQSQEKVSGIPTKMLCFLTIWNWKLSVCIFLLRV